MDDLPWGETSLVRVGARQVEVELVKGSLGQEVSAAGEGFQVKELVFDEAMDGFDVALVSVSGRGNADMLGAEVGDGGGEVGARTVGLQLADELRSVVGLPGEMLQVDATALQMDLDALGEERTGLGRAPGGKGDELPAGANFASGVLDGG